ncbi:MAG: glycine cleavage system aminomethyltransferase GcvT [Alphaproteobacteria bacterium]
MTDSSLRKTPLYELHKKLGAKMVSFAGYAMPLQYTKGIIHEHNHCRTRAALFDVSHMGQVKITGENLPEVLEAIVPSPVKELKVGKQRYSILMNEKGGILDDLMISNYGDYFIFIVNAACKENDFAILRIELDGKAMVEMLEDRALLALQGLEAGKVMTRIAPDVASMKFMDVRAVNISGFECLVSRSGYTGEDGFEISVRNDQAVALAELLLNQPEVEPAGLGARDTLRLEAGLCLYGSDINEITTPLEAGIDWVFGKRRKEEGNFIGFPVIEKQTRDGIKQKLVGLKPLSKIPARAHTKILNKEGEVIGEVTSGGFSPVLQEPIAMGYVKVNYSEPETELMLDIRGNNVSAKIVPLPFVPHRYMK